MAPDRFEVLKGDYVGHEFHHCIERGSLGGEHAVQGVDLGCGAGEPIEKEPGDTVSLAETIFNKLVSQGVGDVVSPVHELFRALTKLGFVAHVLAEDVSRRNRRDSERLGEDGGLSSLTRSRRTNQEKANTGHLSNPS